MLSKTDELLSQVTNVIKDCSQVGEQYKGVVNLTKDLNDSFKAAVHIITNRLNKHDEMMKDIFKALQQPGILSTKELKSYKDLENEVKINFDTLKKTVNLDAPSDIDKLKKRRKELSEIKIF